MAGRAGWPRQGPEPVQQAAETRQIESVVIEEVRKANGAELVDLRFERTAR